MVSPDASGNLDYARDAQVFIDDFLPTFTAVHGPHQELPLPLCIPQVAGNFDSPFARGYNPVVEDNTGITESEFLAFIDGLNMAIIARSEITPG